MNVQTSAIVINQCERNEIERFEFRGHEILWISCEERGVGLSRNTALLRATGDVLLIADDDVRYIDGYEEIVLDEADILVSYIAKGGKPVLADDKVVVSLDLTITEELKNEGIAREIVRNIQDARKQLDLAITDRIDICFEGDVPAEFVDYIANETVGTVSSFDKNAASISVEAEGVKIYIKKSV